MSHEQKGKERKRKPKMAQCGMSAAMLQTA